MFCRVCTEQVRSAANAPLRYFRFALLLLFLQSFTLYAAFFRDD